MVSILYTNLLPSSIETGLTLLCDHPLLGCSKNEGKTHNITASRHITSLVSYLLSRTDVLVGVGVGQRSAPEM